MSGRTRGENNKTRTWTQIPQTMLKQVCGMTYKQQLIDL